MLMLSFALGGCSTAAGRGGGRQESLQVAPLPEENLLRIQTVLVKPLLVTRSARVPSSVLKSFNQVTMDTVSRELNLELVVPKFESSVSQEIERTSDAYSLQGVIPNDAEYDGVLSVTVRDYRERDGGAMGAERGALISFEIDMKDAETGSLLWQASYRYEDEALSDNLLRLGERNGTRSRFESVSDLFEKGLVRALNSLRLTRTKLYRLS